jgi:hypothetical protein
MHQTTVAQNWTDTRDKVMNSWECGEIRDGLQVKEYATVRI